MSTQSALKPRKILEGVHGVHLPPHSPFTFEEIEHGDLHQSNCERLGVGTNQLLVSQ